MAKVKQYLSVRKALYLQLFLLTLMSAELGSLAKICDVITILAEPQAQPELVQPLSNCP